MTAAIPFRRYRDAHENRHLFTVPAGRKTSRRNVRKVATGLPADRSGKASPYTVTVPLPLIGAVTIKGARLDYVLGEARSRMRKLRVTEATATISRAGQADETVALTA